MGDQKSIYVDISASVGHRNAILVSNLTITRSTNRMGVIVYLTAILEFKMAAMKPLFPNIILLNHHEKFVPLDESPFKLPIIVCIH